MGEISEALRRARLERENRTGAAGSVALSQVPDLDREERSEIPETEPPLEAVAPAVERPERFAPARARCEISRDMSGDWTGRAVLVEPHGATAERFRHFALRVRRRLAQRNHSTLLVTSALHSEGKTMVACNLALALASMPDGGRVALVDLDLRRPSVARRLGIRPTVGIEQVLSGDASLEAVRLSTEIPGLDVYANRSSRADSHVLLSGARLRGLVADLMDSFEIVIFDGPPVLLLSDATLILGAVESCVAVARRGVTRLAALREALEQLPADKLIGEFLNEAPVSKHTYGYYHYGVELQDA